MYKTYDLLCSCCPLVFSFLLLVFYLRGIIMELCFGSYANILRLCCHSSVHNKTLVDALVKTIDPNSRYLTDDAAVSKLLKCQSNFPSTPVSESNGPFRSSEGSITTIVSLARNVNANDLAKIFHANIIPLLDADRLGDAICALQTIILADNSLSSTHSKAFLDCVGQSAEVIGQAVQLDPAVFLAGLFLYTVRTNNKGNDIHYISESFITIAASKRSIVLLNFSSSGEPSVKDDSIRRYIDKLLSTYDKIKTLLYSDAPVRFYDFYVCNNVYYYVRRYNNSNRYETVTISHATANALRSISRFLILSGTGGLGKSMMMRHFLLDATATYSKTEVIPFFIQLKNYRSTYSDLTDFILHEVSSLFPDLGRNQLEIILRQGSALLLFDGLDEISIELASDFQQHLDEFINLYTKNHFIISSRPYGNFTAFSRFTVLNLASFTLDQSLELVDKLVFRPDMPEIKAKFRSELKSTLYRSHLGFSDNPLLLTLMMMTFEEFAEVPSKMHVFYQEAYTVLSKRHDASKGGFRRTLNTGVTVDVFAEMFSRFCANTYKDEKFEFSKSEMDRYFRDLQCRFTLRNKSTDDFIFDTCSNLCIIFLESGKYNFIHRSFQEYFCARYFAQQKDRNLERIGKLFENNRLARRGDHTLQMLYDMIPQKVEEYIIIPYLKNLLFQCDSNDGYHTFLQIIYNNAEMGDGEAADYGSCYPSSVLYDFILHQLCVSHSSEIDVSDFDNLELLSSEPYYEINDEGYGTSVVDSDEIPDDYTFKYGEPDEVGRVYTFDWEVIFSNPEEYQDLISSIDKDDFPLKKEYKDIRTLYEELVDHFTPNDDDDLFDILD